MSVSEVIFPGDAISRIGRRASLQIPLMTPPSLTSPASSATGTHSLSALRMMVSWPCRDDF